MKHIPLRDVVIIEKDVETERGGIIVPESMKDPAGTDTGVIRSINARWTVGECYEYAEVKVGQRVLFLRKHGIAIKGSKTLLAVRYANLLAVVED